MALPPYRNAAALALSLVISCGGSTPKPATPAPPPGPLEKSRPVEPDESDPSEASGDCPSGMVAVSGGSLALGANAAGASDEHPETRTSVSTFCLDAHEVTVAEYQACEKNRACSALSRDAEPADRSKLCSARLADNADLPATCVSHDEATRYCAWKGHRLPSEAEWEWVATGGEDKLPWAWGDSAPNDEKLCWQRPRGPCRVKSKPPGAFELYDVLGNVAEWTSTAYGPYGGAAAGGDRKVVRGGSWESAKDGDVRPKKRTAKSATVRDPSIGFRCAANR